MNVILFENTFIGTFVCVTALTVFENQGYFRRATFETCKNFETSKTVKQMAKLFSNG